MAPSLIFPHAGAVLVVDGDTVVLRLAQRQLMPLDCWVITCSDPRRALNHIKCGNICVVVADISMPKISGFALLRRIREQDSELPIVLMSGCAISEVTTAALEYGASEFLSKPFSAEKLRRTVSAAAAGASLTG